MKGITGKKPLKKGVTIFLVVAAACVILGFLLSRLIGNGDGTVVGERGKISIEDEYIGPAITAKVPVAITCMVNPIHVSCPNTKA